MALIGMEFSFVFFLGGHFEVYLGKRYCWGGVDCLNMYARFLYVSLCPFPSLTSRLDGYEFCIA